MIRKFCYSAILLIVNAIILSGQVKVRLFAAQNSDTIVFSVTSGEYRMEYFPSGETILVKGHKGIIVRSGAKILSKSSKDHFRAISDSVIITGITGNDSFSLSVDNSGKRRRDSGQQTNNGRTRTRKINTRLLSRDY